MRIAENSINKTIIDVIIKAIQKEKFIPIKRAIELRKIAITADTNNPLAVTINTSKNDIFSPSTRELLQNNQPSLL